MKDTKIPCNDLPIWGKNEIERIIFTFKAVSLQLLKNKNTSAAATPVSSKIVLPFRG